MFEGKFMVGEKMLSNDNIPSDIKLDKELLKNSLVSKMDAPNPQNGGNSNSGRGGTRNMDDREYKSGFVNTNQMLYRSTLEQANTTEEVRKKVSEITDEILENRRDQVRILDGDHQDDINRVRNSTNNAAQAELELRDLQAYYNDLVNTETQLKNHLLDGLKEEVGRLESEGTLGEDEVAEINRGIERRR